MENLQLIDCLALHFVILSSSFPNSHPSAILMRTSVHLLSVLATLVFYLPACPCRLVGERWCQGGMLASLIGCLPIVQQQSSRRSWTWRCADTGTLKTAEISNEEGVSKKPDLPSHIKTEMAMKFKHLLNSIRNGVLKESQMNRAANSWSGKTPVPSKDALTDSRTTDTVPCHRIADRKNRADQTTVKQFPMVLARLEQESWEAHSIAARSTVVTVVVWSCCIFSRWLALHCE